jgi:hypothetical protein
MTDEPKATPRDIAYECVPKDIAQNWREEIVDRIEEVLNQSVNERDALLAENERLKESIREFQRWHLASVIDLKEHNTTRWPCRHCKETASALGEGK